MRRHRARARRGATRRKTPAASATEGGGGRLVTLLETTYLPGAASVHVVRVADRYYVIGRGGGEIAPLCEIPADRVAAHMAATASEVGPLRALSRRLRHRSG